MWCSNWALRNYTLEVDGLIFLYGEVLIRNEKPLVDYARKLTYNEKAEIVFNFGKNKGKPVVEDRSYARWMCKEDFPLDTKKHLEKIFKDFDSVQESSKEEAIKKKTKKNLLV